MRLITAVINPSVLDRVRAALDELEIPGMTVAESRSYDQRNGHTEIYRGVQYPVTFRSEARLEIVVEEQMTEAAMHTLTNAARTEEGADGTVWVTPVETVVRVRTGERGPDAI